MGDRTTRVRFSFLVAGMILAFAPLAESRTMAEESQGASK